MPEIVKLLIRNAAAGMVLSVVFVSLLIATDTASLLTLMKASPEGWLAAALLYFFCFLTFGSVQIGIAIMHIGQDRSDSGGGNERRPIADLVPAPAVAQRRPAPQR